MVDPTRFDGRRSRRGAALPARPERRNRSRLCATGRGDDPGPACANAERAAPTRASGPRDYRQLLLPIRIGSGPTRVPGIDHVRVKAQLDVLPERLRLTAGAIRRDRPVEAQRRRRVVVLPGEHADRVRMSRAGGRLSVAGDLPGKRELPHLSPRRRPRKAPTQASTSSAAFITPRSQWSPRKRSKVAATGRECQPDPPRSHLPRGGPRPPPSRSRPPPVRPEIMRCVRAGAVPVLPPACRCHHRAARASRSTGRRCPGSSGSGRRDHRPPVRDARRPSGPP